MSRRQILAINPRHTVYVGWDQPMRTFFGQVYDPTRCEDENPLFWTGADRAKQHPEISGLVLAMERYAAIGPETQRMLFLDRELGR